MSQATSFIIENSTPVGKKRNWMVMVISSLIGGVVAGLSVFATAALMPPGEVCFIASTTVTGIIWGIATKIAGNILGSERMIFTLRQYLIQQSYRKTIEQHIGTMMEDVVTSIQTHSPFELQERVYFAVDDKLRFYSNGEHRMFFDFSCKVIPRSGTSPRPLLQGVSAPDLPNFDPRSTQTIVTERKGLVEGIRHGFQEGVLLGLASGASASLLFLVLGKAGIFLGIIGATILVAQNKNLAPPSAAPDKAVLIEEFRGEAFHQMTRLVCCAVDNTVGLELDMQVWPATINPGAVHPTNGEPTIIFHFFNWTDCFQERSMGLDKTGAL